MTLTLRNYWIDQLAAGGTPASDFQYIWTATRTGVNTWSAKQKFYDMAANPPPGFLSSDFIDGISAGVNVESQALSSVPIVLALSSGGGASEQLFYIPGANTAPIVINAAARPNIWDFVTQSQGPFFYNNAWWLIGYMGGFGSASKGSPGPGNMSVWKNTNPPASWSSSNWTRMDQAHEPGTGTCLFWQRFDGSGSKLRFFVNTVPYPNGPGSTATFKLMEFDMAAGVEAYGSLHDPVNLPINQANAPNLSGFQYSQVTGITHIFYGASSPPLYAFLSGGTWTTGIGVGTPGFTGFGTLSQAILDPDGATLHTFYGSSTNLVYQQIQSGGVMGPAFQFPSNTAQYDGGHGVIFTDFDGAKKLAIVTDWAPPSTNDRTPAVFIGSPLSSPTFPSSPELVSYYAGDISTCSYLVLEGSQAILPYANARICPHKGRARV